MEEIDNIILESLRNLHCDIDEDVTNLKSLDPNMILTAISTCLETILPGTNFPKKQPSTMAAKLKIATTIAQQIKELGFREDIGYQTILYSNETEIRRVLMFLIERLPRDSSKTHQIEQTGYVPTLVKEIEKKIKDSLEQFWLPSCVLDRGCRRIPGSYIIHSTGDCQPLKSKNIKIPSTTNLESDAFKQYWVRNVPEITKQCDDNNLPASLLFRDDSSIDFDCNIFKELTINSNRSTLLNSTTPATELQTQLVDQLINIPKVVDDTENKLQKTIAEIKEKQSKINELVEEIKNYELTLSQTNAMKNKEDSVLKETESKIVLKNKTLTILNKEENIAKLKNLVETNNNKLVHLANQWNEIQTPLLEQYKSLQNTLNSKDAKYQQEQNKVKKLKENLLNMTNDLKEKSILEEKLRQKVEHLNKTHNRAGYTRRILEIISNIKKQDMEITKILDDTRQVQKEINNLTGQVERSFTLSDELIFQDAKHDETARKAYKLLVTLHEECSAIIKAVTDLGLAERESRNLQEQIDSETMKETKTKLDNVYKDLEEIRKETDSLLKQQKK